MLLIPIRSHVMCTRIGAVRCDERPGVRAAPRQRRVRRRARRGRHHQRRRHDGHAAARVLVHYSQSQPAAHRHVFDSIALSDNPKCSQIRSVLCALMIYHFSIFIIHEIMIAVASLLGLSAKELGLVLTGTQIIARGEAITKYE